MMITTSFTLSRVHRLLPTSQWLPGILIMLSGMVLNQIFAHVLLVDSYNIAKRSVGEPILGANNCSLVVSIAACYLSCIFVGHFPRGS